MIPFPFTRVVFSYGEPIVVPRDASDAKMETTYTELVQKGLEETQRKAREGLEDESLWKA